MLIIDSIERVRVAGFENIFNMSITTKSIHL